MPQVDVKFPISFKPYLEAWDTKVQKNNLIVDKYRHYLLDGGRGSAKSFTVSTYLALLGTTRKYNILCTREIQNSIKDSVYEQIGLQIETYKIGGYRFTNNYIYNADTNTSFMFEGLYRNVTKIKSIPDIDIAWQEEAESLSNESLRILIPTIRKKGSKLIYTFNQALETSPIYQLFFVKKRTNAFFLHTTYLENPFCPQELIDEADECKERDYDEYLHTYLGYLKQQEYDTAISATEVQKAIERKITDDGAIEFGVDCARYGNDSSTIAKRKGMRLVSLKEFNKLSVPALARKVMEEVNFDKSILIKVDVGGLGAGVYDIIKEEGYRVLGINNGGTAKNKDRYENVISEMWKEFKDLLPHIQLIENTRLKSELTTRKYKSTAKSKYMIECKDDYKKRGYKSPDCADAVLLAFYVPSVTGYFSFV